MKIIEQGIPRHMRGDITNGDLMVLRDELARLQAERRWIPVGERLPEVTDCSYLCICDPLKLPDARFVTIRFFRDSRQFNDLDVTHWMPLPPLPEPPASEVGG